MTVQRFLEIGGIGVRCALEGETGPLVRVGPRDGRVPRKLGPAGTVVERGTPRAAVRHARVRPLGKDVGHGRSRPHGRRSRRTHERARRRGSGASLRHGGRRRTRRSFRRAPSRSDREPCRDGACARRRGRSPRQRARAGRPHRARRHTRHFDRGAPVSPIPRACAIPFIFRPTGRAGSATTPRAMRRPIACSRV